MKKYIENKINELLMEKSDKNITPIAIDTVSLYNSVIRDVNNSLNDLFEEGKISTYKSINNKMIKKDVQNDPR